jgi:D-glycero-D-manno-heptose 1,7-bisphosphate phosphatase
VKARAALFLDRDGVIVRDVGGATDPAALHLLEGSAEAIARAGGSGLAIVVVTNQPIVARGLASEADVRATHAALGAMLLARGARVDAFYFCPHHPRATLERYRVACECRKPRPGMLQRAASELGLDLRASVMVGDRISDVEAGARAGCLTVLVETGMHTAPPIESPDGAMTACADFVARDLAAAVDWTLGRALAPQGLR